MTHESTEFKTYHWFNTKIHVHNAIACDRSTIDIWRFLKLHHTAAIRNHDDGTEPHKRSEDGYYLIRSAIRWVYRRINPDGSISIWPADMPPTTRRQKRDKLTDQERAEVIRAARAGETQKAIAERLGLSQSVVSRALAPLGLADGSRRSRRQCDGVGANKS